MSSRGELFITEDIRDKFKVKLDKMFGKDCWELDGGDYYNLWDERNFPDVVEVNIENVEGDKIGEIRVQVKFSVEGDELYGRAVEVRAGKLLLLTKAFGD